MPEGIMAGSRRPSSERTPEPRWQPTEVDEEDRTRTYSAETVDKLLHGETAQAKPQGSAADDVTRVGELPIEELIRAQAQSSNTGVGFEDVTRVYDLPKGEPDSESTSPKKRALAAAAEPLVIIQPEPPKSSRGWLVALALLAAVAAAGWVYRAPVTAQVHQLQGRLSRGLAPEKPVSAKPVAEPLVTISVSVSPADARLTLDGASVTNPFSVQRAADKLAHTLVAEAPGYAPLRRNVQFERDLTVVLALAPLPHAAAPAEVTKTTEKATTRVEAPLTTHRAVAAPTSKKAPPASSAPASGSCSPPYSIDASGIKTYKPECL